MNYDDYDSPWKDAITNYFPEFMAFYFPNAFEQIDWQQPYHFLDQELQQIVQDAELGKRIVDRLVQVETLQNTQQLIYIHIEIQGQKESDFAQRLFVYNYRLFDRYHCPIATLAILADDNANWHPQQFGYEIFGCEHYLKFPSIKLLDYQSHLTELLEQDNVFALITAAHLLTRQTKNDNQQRFSFKWQLTRLLYERNWDKQRIIDLFSIIDWMMRLPKELEQQLWSNINQLERNQTMRYVTSVERIGMERGIEQGILQGMQEGIQQGEQSILLRQLTRRFGILPESLQERIKQANLEQLELWSDVILTASSLDDIFDKSSL
ncbi:DUF4351 domain-containing protein [Candidatus Albibeggiatoa sp. nov. BB20]|uniref:DUF4351 domain-containing protein n=1 Tax=Candidatus Albibeggiatoa sp. nov. BB20 TaxID=3162723 RepID=UPI0033654B22